MSEGKLGVENLERGLVGVVTLANACLEAAQDGVVSIGDAKSLFGLAEGAAVLAGVHLGTVLEEVKDLYPAEQARLMDVIKEKLNAEQASPEKVAAVCEASKVVYESLWNLVAAIKAAKDSVIA
jgi:hypothetical protein